jgi:hypothetical protein
MLENKKRLTKRCREVNVGRNKKKKKDESLRGVGVDECLVDRNFPERNAGEYQKHAAGPIPK